jgi:cytidylate kinase
MILAIDGPAGTGKSTIAAIIAKKLDITYLNSGSFYRALTFALLQAGMNVTDSQTVTSFCRKQKLDYVDSHLILNGTDVESLLHGDAVSAHVAQLSAVPEIRHLVNARMREITKSLSIVCEGRDMTTVVFPDADYKFYLDASIDVQAMRRYKQGVSSMSLEEIRESIRRRDEIDKNKKEGALRISPDALYIDTSDLTIDQVCAIIINKIHV